MSWHGNVQTRFSANPRSKPFAAGSIIPKLEYREVIERPDVTSKMTFRLEDENGKIIPESEEEMQPCIGGV